MKYVITVAEKYQSKYVVDADNPLEAYKAYAAQKAKLIDGSSEFVSLDLDKGLNGVLKIRRGNDAPSVKCEAHLECNDGRICYCAHCREEVNCFQLKDELSKANNVINKTYAYDEGWQAGYNDKLKDCPYPDNSAEAKDWLDGYDQGSNDC